MCIVEKWNLKYEEKRNYTIYDVLNDQLTNWNQFYWTKITPNGTLK